MKLSALTLFSALFILILSSCSDSGVTESMDKYELTDVGNGIKKAQLKNADGKVLEEGYLVNGVRQGSWIKLNPKHGYISSLQSYVNGQLYGTSLILNERLMISDRSTYAAGQLNGIKATYKHSKPQTESHYKNGLLHGRALKFHNSSKRKILSETDFVNGKQHGIYRYYDDKGNLTLDYKYENGEKISGGMISPTDTTK